MPDQTMAYNPSNALRPNPGEGGLLNPGEIEQGILNANQDAIRVEITIGGLPVSPSNPLPIA